jgi:hypothetical protein
MAEKLLKKNMTIKGRRGKEFIKKTFYLLVLFMLNGEKRKLKKRLIKKRIN